LNGNAAQLDHITFASGFQIVLGDPGLIVSQRVEIDGTSSPTYSVSSGPVIEIDGSAVLNGLPLVVNGADVTIRALRVHDYGDQGIRLGATADRAAVEASRLGTDSGGTTAEGTNATGIGVLAPDARIGGGQV